MAICRVRLILALVVCGCVPAAFAGPREQFAKLESRMETANEEYAEAIAKWKADGKKSAKPADPRAETLEQMDAVAESTLGMPDGAYIAVQCFVWSWMYDIDLPELYHRFERIVEHYPNTQYMAELLDMVPMCYVAAATPAEWTQQVRNVFEAAKDESVKLTALSALGQLYIKIDKPKEAKAAFDRIIKLDPESHLATKAGGLIYELEHLQPGMSAPPFTTKTLDGKEIKLSDFRGKVVLLNFWATWCPTCISEIPDLKKATKHFEGKPFVILAVSLDDSRSMLKQFVKGAEFPGIHTWHEEGADNPVSELYNAEMLPTWYVIDAQGIIRARDPFHDKLIPAVEKALGKG